MSQEEVVVPSQEDVPRQVQYDVVRHPQYGRDGPLFILLTSGGTVILHGPNGIRADPDQGGLRTSGHVEGEGLRRTRSPGTRTYVWRVLTGNSYRDLD